MIGSSNHITGGESDPLHQATKDIVADFIEQPVDDGDPNTSSVIYDGHTADDISSPIREAELAASPFQPKRFEIYNEMLPYNTQDYAALMNTYSAVKALADKPRLALLGKLASVVEIDFGGIALVQFAPSLGVYQLRA